MNLCTKRSKLCNNLECQICFDKSFASHDKSKYWSDKNQIEENGCMRLLLPREVFKGSSKKFWFNCNICSHKFDTDLSGVSGRNRWCPYCCNNSEKLCNEECKYCFDRSFANNPKSEFWSDKNTKKPRNILKNTHKKYWFNCDKCSHEFEAALSHVSRNRWCPYCCNNSEKLCNDDECKYCFERSFACHSKSEYWLEKNEENPREILKYSHYKYWFKCNKCFHDFEGQISSISNGGWCPYCNSRILCTDNDCKDCFNKSFASYEKNTYWSDKNEEQPREVFKGTHDKYLFNCNKCSHEFETALYSIVSGVWCPYCCSEKLCNNECKYCFDRSFANHPKSKFWSEKNNKKPRQVFKSSGQKYLLNCNKCHHEFETTLSNITSKNPTWCPYCSEPPKILCNDENCNECFKHSFASHVKSEYWSEKNEEIPRKVFKLSAKKIWFNCNKCFHQFEATLSNITYGSWCPYCASSKLEQLTSEYFDRCEIKYNEQKTFEDLKNIKCLPFDFYIPEINTLIELDGIQHFEYTVFFHRNEEIFKKRRQTDIKKNFYAISNNYNYLRLSYLELPKIEFYLEYFINKVKKSDKQVIMYTNPKLYRNTYMFLSNN